MAITKAEVTQTLTKEQLREVKTLEQSFDKALKDNYDNEPLFIDLERLPDDKIQKELKRRYKEAGWRTKFESDQREGSYIVIS
jgi:hypothetical protein